MRKLLTITALAALVLPGTALADPQNASDRKNAAEICEAQRTQMGATTFRATYGTNANRSNAFGKCVSRQAHAVHATRHEALSQCQAERRDPNFAQTHGGKTFEQYYGGGRRNALRNCVDQKTEAAQTQLTQRTVNAAQACRAQRASMGARDFALLYGTNSNRSNAFGRCVSKEERHTAADEANAAEQCRAEQADPTFPVTHGGKTFAEFYGRNADRSDAFGNCVSTKAKAAADARKRAATEAAQLCKAERAADPVAFRNRYGTNRNKSNAFARCVAQHSSG